jgi:hypothetical protein
MIAERLLVQDPEHRESCLIAQTQLRKPHFVAIYEVAKSPCVSI